MLRNLSSCTVILRFSPGFWKCISATSLLPSLIPIVRWVQRYAFFSNSVLLITGLVFSRSIVEHNVMAILITYLTDNWPEENLMKSAAIVNAQEGISGILEMILAFVADKLIGRLNMVILTTIAYIIGLVLFWMHAKFLAQRMELLFFILASFFTAIGQAGENFLRDFLEDQVTAGTQNIKDDYVKEDIIEGRANVWWRVAWACGALLVLFYFAYDRWLQAFKVSSLFMIVSFVLFLCGLKTYEEKQPCQSPIVTVYKVAKAMRQRRRAKNSGRHPRRMTIASPPTSDQRNERASASTNEEEDEVKRFLTLIPILLTYCTYTLVAAAGSTFFVEQASNMESQLYSPPVVFFFILQRFSRRICSFIVDMIAARWKLSRRSICPRIVRIGAGMVFSFLCILTAKIVEEQRLQMVRKYEILSHPDNVIPMSVFVLVPQFFLLGLMEALAEDGLDELISTYMKTKAMRQYSEALFSWMLGFAKLFSLVVVHTLRGWFKETVNASRLDKYYGLLAMLSFLNFFLYMFITVPIFAIAKEWVSSKIKRREGQIVVRREGQTFYFSCRGQSDTTSTLHAFETCLTRQETCASRARRGHNMCTFKDVADSFLQFLKLDGDDFR